MRLKKKIIKGLVHIFCINFIYSDFYYYWFLLINTSLTCVGKQQIREMAGHLNLNKHCTDTAFNFFKMAISKRLSRGRRIVHIVAACLYMTCRTEGTPRILSTCFTMIRLLCIGIREEEALLF